MEHLLSHLLSDLCADAVATFVFLVVMALSVREWRHR
jgi:hypothetical protein